MKELTADPYAVLGVGRNATQQQIASAYRRLAKRHHPDVQAEGLPPDRMRRLNQAWEILSSPVERARYDADHTARGPVVGHWSVPRREARAAWSRSGAGVGGAVTDAWCLRTAALHAVRHER